MVSAEDIRQTVERAEEMRSSYDVYTSFRETYYCPDLHIEEPIVPQDARTEEGAPTWGSSATPYSAAFDTVGGPSEYSMSTSTPSIDGVEPIQLQRPTMSDHSLGWLPCEFMRLTGCGASFRFQEINLWIEHMVDEHLAARFPAHSICWFCEEADFKCRSKRAEEKREKYRQRMYHIAAHFFEGQTAANVQPDFFFLGHLHRCGLIDEHTFQRAKSQGQLPAIHMPHDFYDDAETSGVASQQNAEASRRNSRLHSSQRHRSHRHRH